MYITLKKKPINQKIKILRADVTPNSIIWDSISNQAQIKFSDDNISIGSCIRCFNTPCMNYSEQEIKFVEHNESQIFNNFTSDNNTNVCPTMAITFTSEQEAPTIEKEKCILCGICINRCPVRAIFLDADGASINDKPNSYFIESDILATEESTLQITSLFKQIPESGTYITENNIKEFDRRVSKVPKTHQFPNHLARNLLIALQIQSSMRRLGDNNIRMDILFNPYDSIVGTAEVEFGQDILDAPSNILDNIAVLISHYEIPKENIQPLIICQRLPNSRSEYWHIIKDISHVLGIKIYTITLGMLVVLVWNRAQVDFRIKDLLYVDVDNPSLQTKAEYILKKPILITEEYPGLFESTK